MPRPAFTPDPPQHQQAAVIRLRRVATQPVTGVCTATKPVGVLLHYHQGRTIPHYENTTCEPCRDGNTPRWKGYITLTDQKTKQHWLQEYTPAAHEGIADALRHFGSLRGHLLRLERIRPTKNAPMRSEVYLSQTPESELPPEPDIANLLYRIWQLEPNTTPRTTTTDQQLTHLAPNRPRSNGQPSQEPVAPSNEYF